MISGTPLLAGHALEHFLAFAGAIISGTPLLAGHPLEHFLAFAGANISGTPLLDPSRAFAAVSVPP